MDVGFWHDPRSGRWGISGRRCRHHRGRRFRRGILKLALFQLFFALLKVLLEAPRHRSDLVRAFREKGWVDEDPPRRPRSSSLFLGGQRRE
jgi:hypothetical protein